MPSNGMPLAAVELEDPAGDVVEEVAVVGDGDDGALVLLEEALEPRDRLGVEVVRRLVEQQQVGRGEQQPAERDAPALAAGERRRRRGRPRAAAARPSRGRASRRGSRRRARSIWSCTFACSASSASKSASGSANGAEIALKRSSRSRSSRTPSSTLPRTSLAASSSGSCARKPTVAPGASSATPLRRLLEPGHDPQQRRLAGAVRARARRSWRPGRNESEMFASTCRSGP